MAKFEYEEKGNDEIWLMTETSDDIKISYVTSFLDLKVYYVKSNNYAGWKNKKHKLQRQIG